MIFFETTRLILRSYGDGDEEQLLRLITSNRQRLDSAAFSWTKDVDSFQQARMYIRRMRMSTIAKNLFVLGVWKKPENILVGEISGFKIDWQVGKMEIGAYIDSRYESRGIATEAVRNCVPFFFREYPLHKIEALIHMHNHASQKFFAKCDFLKDDVDMGDYLRYSISR